MVPISRPELCSAVAATTIPGKYTASSALSFQALNSPGSIRSVGQGEKARTGPTMMALDRVIRAASPYTPLRGNSGSKVSTRSSPACLSPLAASMRNPRRGRQGPAKL
ncbi:hypothetical protein D9M72_635090 [compost metagenome]